MKSYQYKNKATILFVFVIFYSGCSLEKVHLKEIYFRENKLSVPKGKIVFKEIRKCVPEQTDFMTKSEFEELFKEAFKISSNRNWYNVELYDYNRKCRIFKGNYYEE